MNAYVHAPIERVWAFLIDYAGYARVPQVQGARVLRPGTSHAAGVGAIREITVLGSTFEEEIVGFDPPRRLAYRITRSRPLRLEHRLGECELIERGGGTEVRWTTTFTVPIPIVGPRLAKVLRLVMQHTFNEILLWVKDDLEQQG
jgi:hypothetical protein